ncbi:glycosyltransferase [Paenibacillus sp. DYY-L-2]|uniref:glycosyltransferase n=1 Tax=Paenibacillus sp. DYY-L-2 TaxID=3447013 RepID=UPI003F50C8A1
MSRLPLSICMIVKDEEYFLEDCLKSVVDYASEIIIADTGSSDNSVQIAQSFGAKVISISWNENFAEARNRVLRLATQPHILTIDADERLAHDSIMELKNYIDSDHSLPGRVIIKNLVGQEDYSYSQSTRIFPNTPDYRYSGEIHEQLRYMGRTPQSIDTHIILLHYGYKPEYIDSKNKIQRNLQILMNAANKEKNDLYILYQLGKTYYVAKEYQESFEILSRMIDLIPEKEVAKIPYAPNAWLTICYSLYYLKNYSLLNKYIESGIDHFSDYTDLYFIYGLMLTSMNHPSTLELIPSVFNHCLVLGEADPTKYETSRGVGSFKAHYNLGIYWEILGHVDTAKKHYLLSAKDGYKAAIIRLTSLEK